MQFKQILIEKNVMYALTTAGEVYFAHVSSGYQQTKWKPLEYQEEDNEEVGAIQTS